MSTRFDKDGTDKGGPDKDLPDEQQLDEYLRGGSAVSQQYRQLRSTDVPDELDRLVLRQAQEAVKERPAKSRAWMRWAGPLALAASTVLVVSIVIESGVHEETYLPVPASAPAVPPPKPEAPQASEAQEKAVAGSSADTSVVPIVPLESERLYDAPADFVLEAPAPAPAPPPAPAAAEDRTLAFQPTPRPAAAPAVDQVPAGVARREEVQVTARARSDTSANAPAALSSQAHEEDSRLEEIVMTAQKRREQPKRTAGPRNTVAAPAAADSASDADERADESRDYSDPEQWLRDIRQLRKENKHEEADREWRRFRFMFPDYQVAETDLARGAPR